MNDSNSVITADDSKQRKKSNTQQLVEFAQGRCQLYRDKNGETYASFINSANVREVWPIRSGNFRNIVGQWYYKQTGQVLMQDALKEGCEILHACATYEGELAEVYRRVAQHGDSYYVDLCDDTWRQIEVSPQGYKTVVTSPVLFTRSARMQPLPAPTNGVELSELWRFIRVPAKDQMLVLVWMLECFRSNTVYPILEIIGGQGTGKTTLCKMLKSLIDPAKPELQSRPKSTDDLYISARNNHLVAIENLSHLSEDMQDTCCQISTGSGVSKRKLYSDADEVSYEVHTPLLLNGIVPLATRPDMISRTIRIRLEPLEGSERKTESSVMKDFEEARPRILAALMHLQAIALATPVSANRYQLPRLADFALLGEAIGQHLGQPPGAFIQLMEEMQKASYLAGAEASPFIEIIIQMAEQSDSFLVFEGNCLKLLEKVRSKLEFPPAVNEFPRGARKVKDCLLRHETILTHFNIRVEDLGRRNKGFTLRITKKINPPSNDSVVDN